MASDVHMNLVAIKRISKVYLIVSIQMFLVRNTIILTKISWHILNEWNESSVFLLLSADVCSCTIFNSMEMNNSVRVPNRFSSINLSPNFVSGVLFKVKWIYEYTHVRLLLIAFHMRFFFFRYFVVKLSWMRIIHDYTWLSCVTVSPHHFDLTLNCNIAFAYVFICISRILSLVCVCVCPIIHFFPAIVQLCVVLVCVRSIGWIPIIKFIHRKCFCNFIFDQSMNGLFDT